MQVTMCIIIALVLIVIAIGVTIWIRRTREFYYPTGYQSDYTTFGQMYNKPLFEPDLLRRCAQGSYMYSDNPQLGAFCSSVPPSVLQAAACPRAYHGRPFHMSYTVPGDVSCPPGYCGQVGATPCGMRQGCCGEKTKCGLKEPCMQLS